MDIMDIEQLYWQFDAAHCGIGEYTGMARSERDAFKLVVGHALAEKDREIANLMLCQCEGCDSSLEGEAYCQSCWMNSSNAHHALMAKAVRFAECVERDPIADYDDGELATKFLTSPEVRAWREQQGGKP